ncbi:MAG: PAS domain S-box protein [Candidatus Lokiarchaeota archaeon]|nr:PAS domain S-box protein [Candidatus Lokiarchaeota archaeon]MBD3340926.1 PAS domain S-box protein [Candidatus Lokiarchaeota archaeon]
MKDPLFYYKLIAENANDMIRVLDNNFRIEYINEGAHRRILGYSSKDLIGQFVLNFVHPEDKEKVINFTRKHLKKKSGIIELRIKKNDGNYIWVETNGKIIERDDHPSQILIILRNIDKQKKYERKIKRSEKQLQKVNALLEKQIKERSRNLKQVEKKYQDLFEASPNPIIISDLDGYIIDCNQATLKKLGFSKDEFLDKHYTSYKDFQDLNIKNLKQKFRNSIKKDMTGSFDVQLITKNGKLIWVNFNFSIFKSGTKHLIQIILHDITESKKKESELIRISDLKSENLKTITHELKIPLTAIKGNCDLILNLDSQKIEEKILKMVENIKQGTNRLELLINHLLEVAFLKSSKALLNKEYQNLADLIKDAVKQLSLRAKAKSIEIDVDIHDRLYTKFDREKLNNVLLNLINNAIKFTQEGGKVRIKSGIDKENYIVSIRDTGIGFIEGEKEKLFKEFGKIERNDEDWLVGIEGTGLGLFITKRALELHDGKIWVESEGRGKGSKFSFSIPIIEN